ncbi:nucleotidyltransferase family protein, partial [Myxococcota bacterium]|nr:nucleotidyltransferase family protein [Myxococcota bacterium]
VLLASYPSLAARHVDDIDLLVRAEDSAHTGQVLSAAGFAVRASGRMRHPLIATGPRGTLVEIHHGLDDGLDEGLWDRTRTVDVGAVALRVPSVDDLFAHLSHHVLVQHARAPRYLLRHLFDVAALVDGGGAPPLGPSPLATSIELLDLVREAARSPQLAKVFGALLFPTRHSTLHLAVARRFRLGFRGLGTELRALKNVPQYLVYDVDDHD